MDQLHIDRPPSRVSGSGVTFGIDERSKVRTVARDAILLRTGHLRQQEDETPSQFAQRKAQAQAYGFRGLAEAARDYVIREGARGSELNNIDNLMVRAFSHSSSDFPASSAGERVSTIA